MQPVDAENFSSKNPFLQRLCDVAGDKALYDVTGQTIPDSEKEAQRTIFTSAVENLKCLKGHKIVGMILGELETAKTNRDFLAAMKKIEPLIGRVRQKLVEARILEWSSDPLSPLAVRRHEPTRPVSALEKLRGDANIRNNAAIFFINNILPILKARRDEIEKRAHLVGEGVYREEGEFPAGFYGKSINSGLQRKAPTSPSLGVWRGVEFRKGSMGFILLQLCSEHEAGDMISIDEICQRVEGSDAVVDDEMRKRIVGNLYAILQKFSDNKPFKIITKGAGIIINEESAPAETPSSTVDGAEFTLNDEFLDQELDPSTISIVSTTVASPVAASVPVSPINTQLSLDTVDALGLSPNAAKILKYLIQNPSAIQMSALIKASGATADIAISFQGVVDEINRAIDGKTSKRVQKKGTMIVFAEV